MGSNDVKNDIPTIDFCKPELKSGTSQWESTKTEVFQALLEYGYFEAIYDRIPNEIPKTIVDTLEKEVIPMESKLEEYFEKPYQRYEGQIPHLRHETLCAVDMLLPESIGTFVSTFWPDGNPNYWYCLVCTADNCTWRFRASSLNESKLFKIRKFNNVHTCTLKDRVYSQRQATSRVIGDIIRDKFSSPKTTYTPKEIMDDMLKNFGVNISYMKAWRSKEQALKMARGDPTNSYSKLPSYLYILQNSNPGSFVDLRTSRDKRFMYTFVALYASIKGWNYCRPIVVVDGSFLKSEHKGTFLSASTLDAAGSILPLAYAVVDSENDASWEWFFHKFRAAYGQRENMCIVSDRKESISKATSIIFPEVPHYACIWHLWNNIKTNFKKNHRQLHEIFFAMAKAYTIEEFDRHMDDVERIDFRVKEYLCKIGYHRWSRAHSTVNRGWTMTSNIAESLNAANLAARDMPILAFMECMRSLVESWNNQNGQNAREYFKPLGRKYSNILDGYRKSAIRMKVKPSSDYVYSVFDKNNKFIVNLERRTCCCCKFQIDELPCAHALAVLKFKHLDEADYCSVYYTTKNLLRTYEVPVYPLPDERSWKVPEDVQQEVVTAPVEKRAPGRPKRSRYKSPWEEANKRLTVTCGRCGREGHNRKTCRNAAKTT